MDRDQTETTASRPVREIVHDDDIMKVLITLGSPRDCVVSFTGVGRSLGGIDLQSPEFSRWDNNATKIFVIDKNRSWGNQINWKKLRSILEPTIGNARVTTLGNSMGGFLAVLSAKILGADQAIAFAPQWSVDPRIVPEEDRWMKHRRRIKRCRFPDPSSAFAKTTSYYAFFGSDEPKDMVHLNFFSQHIPKQNVFLVKDCGHDVASFLKTNGTLYDVIGACRTGDDITKVIGKDKLLAV